MMETLDLDGLLDKLFNFDDIANLDGIEVVRWWKKPSILSCECCTYNYGSYGG